MIFFKKMICKLCNQLIVDNDQRFDPIRNEKYIVCPCCFQLQGVQNRMGRGWRSKVDSYLVGRLGLQFEDGLKNK